MSKGIKQRRKGALDRLNSLLESTEDQLATDISENQKKKLMVQKKRMLKEISNLDAKRNFRYINK